MLHAIGIDIGGTHVRAALVDADGKIVSRRQVASARDPRVILDRCLALIAALRDAETQAVGIGIPGQVDAARRVALSGGYVDLSGLPFVDRIEDTTGLPVTVENDATMALLGEAAAGAARGQRAAVLLTIGTGIGGAILEGGRVLRGGALAGQLGHIVIDPEGRPCVCGRRGCVETTSAGTALGVHLAEAGLPPGTRAADLLARSDAPARQVLDRWARPLRAAIDSLIAICNPAVVVIGGGAGAAMVAALTRIPPAPSWFSAPVVAAMLGDDAGVIGAALSAAPAPVRKRLVMVNGVPASGKSSVAAALVAATGWPRLTLDTLKGPFLAELAPVDRLMNRRLGRASYNAIFDLIGEAPGGTFVMDAWFGFQPIALLHDGLARAGVTDVAEIWCHAPPEVIGARYAARVATRDPGHPGLEYVHELEALAERARPMAVGPVRAVDTTRQADIPALCRWLKA